MKRAEEVELGDHVNGERVTGWYFDAKGHVVILHGNRWHTYYPDDKVIE